MKAPIILALALCGTSQALVQITVEADSGRIPISPLIYGKNGVGVSDNPNEPSKDTVGGTLYRSREAGVRMARENAGNNLTKYNWRKKLTSHPDWYNNVYAHDWDFAAQELRTKLPGVLQGMWGFQLLGWVASNTNNNFADWDYSQSHNGQNVPGQNLAGGGVPNTNGGGTALVEGDPNKYLQPWPADSTAAILGHWFGPGGIGLDSSKIRYWNMDNEIEIWDGTHNDVDPALNGHLITAEEAVQRWISVAKAARKLFPNIKLVGPATAAEWQWYTWPKQNTINYNGVNYCWPEYLIKRLSEAQASTGVRMLDVYDIHFYMTGSTKEHVQNQYRQLWDTTYRDPEANGVKYASGVYNPNENRQMIFHRIEGWLDKHFGKGHGIKVGATESGMISAVGQYPSEVAVWYASMLGTFADHGGELFTPWVWEPGMWETLHLFSRYAHSVRVKSTSSLDSLVSAYTSITPANDSMTVILVNRLGNEQNTTVNLKGFVPNGNGTTLRLSNLNGETFVSHTQNALQSGTVAVSNGSFSLLLPSYSVTAVRFAAYTSPSRVSPENEHRFFVRNTSNGFLVEGTNGSEQIQVFDTKGKLQTSIQATKGNTLVEMKALGACFLRIQKGNQVQWHFSPSL